MSHLPLWLAQLMNRAPVVPHGRGATNTGTRPRGTLSPVARAATIAAAPEFLQARLQELREAHAMLVSSAREAGRVAEEFAAAIERRKEPMTQAEVDRHYGILVKLQAVMTDAVLKEELARTKLMEFGAWVPLNLDAGPVTAVAGMGQPSPSGKPMQQGPAGD